MASRIITIDSSDRSLLRRRTPEISEEAIVSHSENLFDLMEELADSSEIEAAGLAANQCFLDDGSAIGWCPDARAILVKREDGSWIRMANPKILRRSEQTEWDLESCLSIPDTVVRVKRSARVVVTWQSLIRYDDDDAECTTWTEEFYEPTSRVVQHEIDHLDGILITDHNDPFDFVEPS